MIEEMTTTPAWYLLAALGLVGGTVSATLGVGSGIILVPALVLAFAFPQKIAQGTTLAVMVPMALMGALRYHLNPEIKLNMKIILLIVPFAIIGANIGSSAAAWLPAHVLRRAFGIFIIVVGARMLWSR